MFGVWEQLVNAVLTRGCAIHIRYQDAFLRYLGMDPLEATTEQLRQRASTLGLVNAAGCDRDGVLDFLMSSAVEPRLGDGIYFVHSYPPSQAALAEVDPGPPARARRFELFVDAVELANGYQELRDPLEQRRRFEHERELRRARGQRVPDVDERLLAALEAGLPPVSGVALGVDRLLMLKLGLDDIRDTLAFALDDA